jgi:hypothetical protein
MPQRPLRCLAGAAEDGSFTRAAAVAEEHEVAAYS